MDYSFAAVPQEGFLRIRVTGMNTPATLRRYLDDVLDACVTQRCPNVLIEEDLTGARLPIAEIFSILVEKSSSSRPGMRLLAVVDLQASDPSNMKFAENVAVNRGVTMRAFETVAEAEQWLRKKLAPS